MVDGQPAPDLRLEMYSQPRLLAAVRALINNLGHRAGFPDIQCGQLSLAVDEALCNVINHGYERRSDGRIWLSIWHLPTEPPAVKLVIEDEARQVDPETIQSRDLEDIRPGGLGVYIIREIMDDVQYERRDGGGMRLTMTKQLDPAAQEEAGEPSGCTKDEQTHG
jgi:serine/threonine-protein kinase RsbW